MKLIQPLVEALFKNMSAMTIDILHGLAFMTMAKQDILKH